MRSPICGLGRALTRLYLLAGQTSLCAGMGAEAPARRDAAHALREFLQNNPPQSRASVQSGGIA